MDHRFLPGDIVELKNNVGTENGLHWQLNTPIGSRAKVIDYKSIPGHHTDYVNVEWIRKPPFTAQINGGYFEECFKLVRHEKVRTRSIAVDNKCFNEILVPRRSRPIKGKICDI